MPVYASVQISEVYYDPIATDSGGEAVELYNPQNYSVDISGYIISTEISDNDAVLPESAVIAALGYYLVADSGWSSSKDDEGWPDADYEEAITLTNTDAGVALKNSSGSIIDAVGWGNSLNIEAGLYEDTPHEGAAQGQSLQRQQDTDDNSADFTAAQPNLKASVVVGDTELQLTINIINTNPDIDGVSVLTDDDSLSEGSQVMPNPNSQKDIKVSAIMEFPGGYNENCTATADFNSQQYDMDLTWQNLTHAVFNATLELQYYDVPGNYTVTVIATNQYGAEISSAAEFEYLTLTGIALDASQLSCNLISGSSCEIIGDTNMNTGDKVTIRNIGNTIVDIGITGTDFTSGENTLEAGNIEYVFSQDFNNGEVKVLQSIVVQNDVDLQAASNKELSFRITSPATAATGNYVGMISVTAVASE